MIQIPSCFQATTKDGLTRFLFDKKIAREFAGRSGKVIPQDAYAIYDSIQQMKREVALSKLSDEDIQILGLKNIMDNGVKISFDDLQKLIVEKGQEEVDLLLDTPIENLDITTRTYNYLKYGKVHTVRDLLKHDQIEILKFRNIGKKSLGQLEEVLSEKGLCLGMLKEK